MMKNQIYIYDLPRRKTEYSDLLRAAFDFKLRQMGCPATSVMFVAPTTSLFRLHDLRNEIGNENYGVERYQNNYMTHSGMELSRVPCFYIMSRERKKALRKGAVHFDESNLERLIQSWRMRYMAFGDEYRDLELRQKFVTRRLGWLNLKPETLLKAGPILPGAIPSRRLSTIYWLDLICVIRVVSIRREKLCELSGEYGRIEAEKEARFLWNGDDLQHFYCQSFRVKPTCEVTRMEFSYV